LRFGIDVVIWGSRAKEASAYYQKLAHLRAEAEHDDDA
jgi:hypothetical protein